MNRTLLNGCNGNTVITFTERPNIEFHISEKEIGRGASCVVYHAVGSDNTEHLLKEYYPKHLDLARDSSGRILVPVTKADAYEQGLVHFRNGCEQQKAIRLSNEGLKNFTCNIQGYYHANGTEYIDMTCFSGQTYDQVQEQSVYNLMLRMKTLAQVVGNYHKAGLLHLDIKPENIYVRPENETIEDVMLFDFDSVTPMCAVHTAKVLSCTKTWAAPEQLLPEKRRSICLATDLFAIGEIVFVQLFGRHSTNAERRSFVTEYSYNHKAEIFKNMNPKVFPLLDELLCHTICGVVGKRYQSAKELIAKLDEIIKIADPKTPYLKSSLPAVQDFFIGRDSEIQEIHRLLNENRILFLNGIGGIGKSELAKHYAVEHKDDYDTIIFAPYISDVNILLLDDNAIPLYNFAPYPEEKPEEYCARKLKKLRELCDEQTLFIVDNLDREDDPDLNKLLDLGCKFLVTTRRDFSGFGKAQLYVDKLESKKRIREIFDNYYKSQNEKESACIDEIIAILEGHTMAVELIAKQIEAEWATASEILEKLKVSGISGIGNSDVDSGKDGHMLSANAYKHIELLFDMSIFESKKNVDAIYVLANLSLFPSKGVDKKIFAKWCELEKHGGKNGVNGLAKAGWIRCGDVISVHPLVAEVCAEKLLNAEIVSTTLKHINQELQSKDLLSWVEISLYLPILYTATKRLHSHLISSRLVVNFMWNAAWFFEDNTGNIDYSEQLFEQSLSQEVSMITDIELHRLRVSSYISVLNGHNGLFGKEAGRDKKIRKWQNHYSGILFQIEKDGTLVGQFNELSARRKHFSNLENTDMVRSVDIEIVALFAQLSSHEANLLIQTEGGYEAFCSVAESYESLGELLLAKNIYLRVISDPACPFDIKEMAYFGVLGILLDTEDWDYGVTLCKEYYSDLCNRFDENHIHFLWYYRFLYAFQVNACAIQTVEDCQKISPTQLYEAIMAVKKYHALHTKHYGMLSLPDKSMISGLAHATFGYVLYFLKLNAEGYAGVDTCSSMSYPKAKVLLGNTMELFQILGDEASTNEAKDYIAYIDAKLTE